MGYIINPNWFYWVSICDALKTAMLIIGTILFIGCATGWICVLLWGSELVDHDERKLRNVLCVISAICVASFLVGIFIPSRNTLIEMQIARLATKGNADMTIDKVKEIVDYIINAMKELK